MNIINIILKMWNKLFSLKNNRYFRYVFVISWVLLILYGKVTIIRLCIFFIILIMIYIYKHIIKYVKNINENEVSELNKKLKMVHKDKLNKLLYVLTKISIITNIILYYVPRMELILYKVFDKIKNKGNLQLKKVILMLLLSILVLPWKYLIRKWYKIWNNFQNLTMYEILCNRIYGSLLSVLIFTDVINFVINICGSRIMLYILVYMVLIVMSIIDYYVKQFNFLSLWNTIDDLYEARIEVGILCSFILILWRAYVDQKFFVEKYGDKIKFEWLKLFSIYSYKNELIYHKLAIFNHKEKILDYILCDRNKGFLFMTYKRNISDILDNLVALEYYKLFSKYNEGKKLPQEVADPVIRLKETQQVKVKLEKLYQINYKILQLLLYLIWDVEQETNHEIYSFLLVDDTGLGHWGIDWEDYGSIFDFGKTFDYSAINISDSYKEKLYEYSQLIIHLQTSFCIVQKTTYKIDKKEYNSIDFVAPEYLAWYDGNEEAFLWYVGEHVTSLIGKMRIEIDGGVIGPTVFEEELIERLNELKDKFSNDYKKMKELNMKFEYNNIMKEFEQLLTKK